MEIHTFPNSNGMKEMIEELIDSGYLKTETIISAFQKIDRADFVSDQLKGKAYINTPLPIGYGQTISQPATVAFMLELLQPELGNKILEIGSGSGWQTALLSHIVSRGNLQEKGGGQVFTIEIIPELEKFGRQNVAKYNFVRSKIAIFHCLNALKGLPEEAPFDRIISAVAASEAPIAWKEQLKIGGRMVLPIKGAIHSIIKSGDNEFEEEKHPGFAFVPFVDK